MNKRNDIFRGVALSKALMLAAFAAGMAGNCQAEEIQLRSKWDQDLLKIELHDVLIKPNHLDQAWREMTTKYLLRANLYLEPEAGFAPNQFSFTKEKATVRELYDAFISAFPAYTYTQDKQTGVVWFHPKRLRYADILSEEVMIQRPALQVSMFKNVFEPLCYLFFPKVIIPGEFMPTHSDQVYGYSVDLPSGIYSARDILNLCCLPNLAMNFRIFENRGGTLEIEPNEMNYHNPLPPPRIAAVRFWETEIGAATNGTPSLDEIGLALSDPNPRVRWAACCYLRAAQANYRLADLVSKSLDSRKAVWAALGLKRMEYDMLIGDPTYITRSFPRVMEVFRNDVPSLDAGLALLISMELAQEKKDLSLMDCVAGHKFTAAEMAVIKPDVYRIARESKLVRDKLVQMKFDVPELSPESLRELENTNLFKLVPDAPAR